MLSENCGKSTLPIPPALPFLKIFLFVYLVVFWVVVFFF